MAGCPAGWPYIITPLCGIHPIEHCIWLYGTLLAKPLGHLQYIISPQSCTWEVWCSSSEAVAMLVSEELWGCSATVCAPVLLGCVQRRLPMTRASLEGWLGAAGSSGSQSLQNQPLLTNSCSLQELIGVAATDVCGPLPPAQVSGGSVNTVVASHLLIVRAKSISILRKYEGLKVNPAFGESNSYQCGPCTHLRCVPQISGMLKWKSLCLKIIMQEKTWIPKLGACRLLDSQRRYFWNCQSWLFILSSRSESILHCFSVLLLLFLLVSWFWLESKSSVFLNKLAFVMSNHHIYCLRTQQYKAFED